LYNLTIIWSCTLKFYITIVHIFPNNFLLTIDSGACSTLAPFRLFYIAYVVDKNKESRTNRESDAILVRILRSFLFLSLSPYTLTFSFCSYSDTIDQFTSTIIKESNQLFTCIQPKRSYIDNLLSMKNKVK